MSEESHIEPDKFICQFCGKQFNRPCNLSAHSKTCVKNPNRISLHKRKEGGWICSVCGLIFQTRAEHNTHKSIYHKNNKGYFSKFHPKKVYKCSFCNKEWETTLEGCTKHEKYCKENPNRCKAPSHPISEDVRKQISSSLKMAHSEGRAHNIGESRWNNEHSYPEKWFISVLENEFNMIENIDYKTEFPFYKYSLDFAWPDKKICIEIDGEQHQRFQDQIRRDLEKDSLLKNNGWIEIRKSWKDIFNNPKLFIEEVKSVLK